MVFDRKDNTNNQNSSTDKKNAPPADKDVFNKKKDVDYESHPEEQVVDDKKHGIKEKETESPRDQKL